MTATTHPARTGATQTAPDPGGGVNVHPDDDRATSIPQRAQAPTADEIRAVILHRLEAHPNDDPADAIRQAIEQMGDFMYGPSTDKLSGEPAGGTLPRKWPRDLWDDLRRPEAARLDALYAEATARALARCLEVATEELVSAALAFAAEYPDAPRAVR